MSEINGKKNKKIKDKDKLTVRDYITLGLMMILVYAVYTAVGAPLAMTIVGNIFIHAICSLLWGTIFMLTYVRINKKWVPLILGVLMGALQIFNLWITALAILVGGIVSEFIWQKRERNFKTMTLCFSVQITSWYLGMFLPLILISNVEAMIAENYVAFILKIKEAVVGPMFFIGLGTVIVCTVIGAFIGRLLLKKHFEKAGLV